MFGYSRKAIVYYTEGYKKEIGVTFFTGYYEDAYKLGEQNLQKYNATYFDVFDADIYTNILSYKNKK